jgi:hypothetical protein
MGSENGKVKEARSIGSHEEGCGKGLRKIESANVAGKNPIGVLT